MLQRPVIHHVRRFLADQDAAIHPWSGLDEACDSLYALLDRRRDDPTFWAPSCSSNALEQALSSCNYVDSGGPVAEHRGVSPGL